VGYWPAGSRYEDAKWYRVEWGRYVTLQLPDGDGDVPLVLSMDRILEVYL
jgi:hypothetical protein